MSASASAPDYVSISEVANRLGLSEPSVYRALAEGKIPRLRLGRRWIIPRQAFEHMLKTGRQPETTAEGAA